MYFIIKEHYFIFGILFLLKLDERLSVENMRADYYAQLRKHLEPENASIQSKTKSIAANSQHSVSMRRNSVGKMKQDLFRNQRPLDSFSSFDTAALM
jgi:hypothetical protein